MSRASISGAKKCSVSSTMALMFAGCSCGFDGQRNDVEVDETIRRVENFEIARDWPTASSQRMPIQTTYPLVELLADRILGVQSEKLTGAVVHVSDFAAGIGDNDSFLDRIEDGFEKSFFLRQSQQIILNIFRLNLAEPTDQFFEKAGFHIAVSPSGANAPSFSREIPRVRSERQNRRSRCFEPEPGDRRGRPPRYRIPISRHHCARRPPAVPSLPQPALSEQLCAKVSRALCHRSQCTLPK